MNGYILSHISTYYCITTRNHCLFGQDDHPPFLFECQCSCWLQKAMKVFGCSLLTWHTESHGISKRTCLRIGFICFTCDPPRVWIFAKGRCFFTSLWLVTCFSLLIAFAAMTSKHMFFWQPKRDRIWYVWHLWMWPCGIGKQDPSLQLLWQSEKTALEQARLRQTEVNGNM